MDGSLNIANDELEKLMALLIANNGHWQNIGWRGKGYLLEPVLCFENFSIFLDALNTMSCIIMV